VHKETLRPADRIRKRSDFVRLRSSDRRVHTRHFVFVLAKNALLGQRLGITVTKKVSTRAVDRNRVKRLLREAFRRSRASCFPDHCDIVAVAKAGADGLDFESVCEEMKGATRALKACMTQGDPHE
jgi:ribonuclease P protein component